MLLDLPLPRNCLKHAMALGGDLKCRPARAFGQRLSLGEDLGDLAGPESQDALEKIIADQDPELLICDQHPGYFSTALAQTYAREKGIPLKTVQHHRAHVAAVCLEHGLWEEKVVGLAFDGTGFGDEGAVWGGEFFTGSMALGFTHAAQFASVPLPGGDRAVREPWRMALALLLERGADPQMIRAWQERHAVPVQDPALFEKGLSAGVALGRSTALGRWFDAAAALLGVAETAAFEAEGAIKLQKLAESCRGKHEKAVWPVEVRPGAVMVIDFPDLLSIAAASAEQVPGLALAFHEAVARATAGTALRLARAAGTDRVIASGGCFLNGLFDLLLRERMEETGLQYLKPKLLPPGDQALALGQIGLAALSD